MVKLFAEWKKRRLYHLMIKGQEYSSNNKPFRAISSFKKALSLIDETNYKKRTKILESIADAYAEIEDWSAVCACYAQSLGLDRNNARHWFALGDCLVQLQEYEAATDSFKQAFWLLADDVDNLSAGAQRLRELGLIDQANVWDERGGELVSSEPE